MTYWQLNTVSAKLETAATYCQIRKKYVFIPRRFILVLVDKNTSFIYCKVGLSGLYLQYHKECSLSEILYYILPIMYQNSKTMKTQPVSNPFSVVDESITYGVQKGLLHLSTIDQKLSPTSISLIRQDIEQTLLNFGSCSYLGLEFDDRLRAGSIEAIDQYGTFFSSSRAYLSTRQYTELEGLFDTLFENKSLLSPTTTLGHFSAIPVLVSNQDAIILDQQVHNSIQMAVNLVKTKGVHCELVRHNRMDLLEDRIKLLAPHYKRIWYMADGVYSMFGDKAPIESIYLLLDKYPQMQFYVDDAHGMSCFGKNGRGFALSQTIQHERMVVATSLAKGFGTGGAVLVFPNPELARKVRTCGGPMITSGPLQPAVLGAAIASAKIHLTEEIYAMQDTLMARIQFVNQRLIKLGLPVISDSSTPVFFIGVGIPRIAYKLVESMLEEGYLVNLAIFPAVSLKNAGVRFTVTRLHTHTQIDNMLQAMSFHLNRILLEEGLDMDFIYKQFRIIKTEPKIIPQSLPTSKQVTELTIHHCNSIKSIDPHEWDRLLGYRSNYNWEGLHLLENAFKNNPLPEDNWIFDYVVIRNQKQEPILATFMTTTLFKDDLLSDKAISAQVEKKRKSENPYFLVSKVISTGCPLSTGNHLYVNRKSPFWKEALSRLLSKLSELQEHYGAGSILVRDLPNDDEEMDGYFRENGFFKMELPVNHVIEDVTWSSRTDYIDRLSRKSKIHLKQDILRHEHRFETTLLQNPSLEELEFLYGLYLQVANRSLELNTFVLPIRLFHEIAKSNYWEILTTTLKTEFDSRLKPLPVAVTFNFRTPTQYNGMILGIDHSLPESAKYNCYKQALYQSLCRARELNLNLIQLGYSAGQTKRMLGAREIPSVGYVQTNDNYSLEVLSSLTINANPNKHTKTFPDRLENESSFLMHS
jgi:7-keto-8-aminopelargonate synthetase-like enzyme